MLPDSLHSSLFDSQLKKSEEKNKQVNTMFDEQVKDNADVKTKMDSLKEELKELQECKATIKE